MLFLLLRSIEGASGQLGKGVNGIEKCCSRARHGNVRLRVAEKTIRLWAGCRMDAQHGAPQLTTGIT